MQDDPILKRTIVWSVIGVILAASYIALLFYWRPDLRADASKAAALHGQPASQTTARATPRP